MYVVEEGHEIGDVGREKVVVSIIITKRKNFCSYIMRRQPKVGMSKLQPMGQILALTWFCTAPS